MPTSTLVDCSHCRRHYFANQGSCPFCAQSSTLEPGRVARFAMAAMTPMVLGACYGSPYKESLDSGPFDDTAGQVGPISGSAGVAIIEMGCDVVWYMEGEQCADCDLGWDVVLDLSDSSTCTAATDTAGLLEVAGDAVYFEGNYWAATTSIGGGAFTWETIGYVYGDGGNRYVYTGAATY